ncbi:MAG TPA: crotonase/enoyl-CoA hydratase family protein [Acidimicrobiales bacterium]|nr:crotonase/enoyl-CoA hydratase family protein [Acidimicrobiales bacterium]
MPDLVAYRFDDNVATVSMDDGKVNVLSPQMLSELNSALDKAEADGATAVVLAGRDGVFSAGFDLKVLTAGGEPARGMLIGGFELALRILSFPSPTVIACTGHGLAMGSFLLLSADHRIGADGPFKIGANEVAIGMVMPLFAVEICRLRLANHHFGRAVTTAEIYSPAGAVEAGWLDRAVPPEEVADAAAAKAAELTKLSIGAYRGTKAAARAGTFALLREAIEADDAAYRALGGL